MLTDSTRKYLCRIVGLYDKKKKKKKNNNVLCYRSVPDSLKCVRVIVKNNGKWTGSWLPVILP